MSVTLQGIAIHSTNYTIVVSTSEVTKTQKLYVSDIKKKVDNPTEVDNSASR
jgi:hypothetical protein